MTGLPDANALPSAFEDARRSTIDGGGRLAVARIDLRDFRAVNEMFGRPQGDLALALVAERIADQLDPEDQLVRLPGDEFALIRASVGGVEEIDAVASAILSEFIEPFEIERYSIVLGANMGITIVEGATTDLDMALSNAETAVFRSKLDGINRYEIFEHSLRSELSPAMMATWLREAVDDDQLHLRYQRIQSLETDRVVAVEALLRWDHPTAGLLTPDAILPALEDSGLIVEVGTWVLREACRQSDQWRRAQATDTPPLISINIATKQLASSGFLDSVEAALDEFGVEPRNICFELGALSVVPANSTIWMVLRECKALGIQLALDNFGNNESSYGLLRRVRLDFIKLGSQLTSAHHATAHDNAIAASILTLARDLGIRTVAEGIEDHASLERARIMGCELGQGFYFGSPEDPATWQARPEPLPVRDGPG